MGLSLISTAFDTEDNAHSDSEADNDNLNSFANGKDASDRTIKKEEEESKEKFLELPSLSRDGSWRGGGGNGIKIRSDIFGFGDERLVTSEENYEKEEVVDIKPIIAEGLPVSLNLALSSKLRIIEIKDEPDPLAAILKYCPSDSDNDDEASQNKKSIANHWTVEKRRRARNWKWIWDKAVPELTINAVLPSTRQKINEDSSNFPKQHSQVKTETGEAEKSSFNVEASIKIEPKIENTEAVERVEAFKCPFCLGIFLEGGQLIKHLPLHTTHKQIMEKEANDERISFKSDTGMHRFNGSTAKHNGKRKGTHPLRCAQCKLSFRFPYYLKRHMRIHDETNGSYKCPHCQSFFLTLQALTVHQNHVHNRPTGRSKYPCNLCGKMFIGQSMLASHKLSHSSERPFSCRRCNSRFKRKDHLERHIKSAHKQRLTPSDWEEIQQFSFRPGPVDAGAPSIKLEPDRYKALIRPCIVLVSRCDHIVPFYKTKKTRANSDKKKEKGKRTAKKCDKKWVRFKPNLLPESNVKTEVNDVDRKSLIKVRTISGNKKFECTACGKLFKKVWKAHAHTVVHTDDRPFECSICGKTFRWRENLFVHSKLHTGLKRYECIVCSKAFMFNSNLNIHMRTHSGVRPFQCPHCPQRFRHSSNLSVHKKSQHPEKIL